MLLVEGQELNMWESSVNSSSRCTIKNNVFSCLRSEETLYNSDIHNYDDLCLVVCNEPRFGENYYNIAVYNDSHEKAWPLITIPRSLDVNVRRLAKDAFVVWSNSEKEEHKSTIKQCTFCKITPEEKVMNVTIDFNVLHNIEILGEKNYVFAKYSQVLGGHGGVAPRTVTMFALYDCYGKMIKVFYEFYCDDKEHFEHKMNLQEQALMIRTINPKNGKKIKSNVFSLEDILGGVIPTPQQDNGADNDDQEGDSAPAEVGMSAADLIAANAPQELDDRNQSQQEQHREEEQQQSGQSNDTASYLAELAAEFEKQNNTAPQE